MHTQTASTSELRAELASRLHAAAGLGLYLLTLAGEVVLGAGVRWLLTYLGAVVLGAVLPLGHGAEQLAFLAALGPLSWSLIGLVLPGRGFVWARRIGARRPSVEEAGLIDDARQLLRAVDPAVPDTHAVYLLDDPIPAGAARGRSVILSRGLLETDSVAFRRYRTRGGSRFEADYLFRRTTSPTTYEMRAQVRESSGYPYVEGDSDPLYLRVLPKQAKTAGRCPKGKRRVKAKRKGKAKVRCARARPNIHKRCARARRAARRNPGAKAVRRRAHRLCARSKQLRRAKQRGRRIGRGKARPRGGR